MKRKRLLHFASLTGILLPFVVLAQGPGSQGQVDKGNERNPAQATIGNWTGPKLRLAVVDINGSALKSQITTQPTVTTTTIAIPPPADFSRGMTEMLTTALLKTDRFVVLERAALDKVVAEQDLGTSGKVHPETAPQAGKLIGAQAIITGDITEFSYSQSNYGGTAIFKGFGAKFDKVNARVAIDLRVVDAVTGEVLASQRSQGSASMSNVSAELTHGTQDFTSAVAENTPLGKATRQALEGVVATILAGMRRVRWSARVIDLRAGAVYINAGSDSGIQPGLQFDVFRPQEALIDPETGRSLGAPDSQIGSVSVDVVQEKYCVAKVTSGGGMKRGDIVRIKGEAQQP